MTVIAFPTARIKAETHWLTDAVNDACPPNWNMWDLIEDDLTTDADEIYMKLLNAQPHWTREEVIERPTSFMNDAGFELVSNAECIILDHCDCGRDCLTEPDEDSYLYR